MARPEALALRVKRNGRTVAELATHDDRDGDLRPYLADAAARDGRPIGEFVMEVRLDRSPNRVYKTFVGIEEPT